MVICIALSLPKVKYWCSFLLRASSHIYARLPSPNPVCVLFWFNINTTETLGIGYDILPPLDLKLRRVPESKVRREVCINYSIKIQGFVSLVLLLLSSLVSTFSQIRFAKGSSTVYSNVCMLAESTAKGSFACRQCQCSRKPRHSSRIFEFLTWFKQYESYTTGELRKGVGVGDLIQFEWII